MMDWLGKMLDLPEEFLFSGPGRGGGVIQVRPSQISNVFSTTNSAMWS